MKKLLSILTISTLTASIPAPLLANTLQTRVKRDVGATAKDVTTGFDIKIKEKYSKDNMFKIDNNDKNSKSIDNKYYIVVWCTNIKSTQWRITKFNNNKEYIVIDSVNSEQRTLYKYHDGFSIKLGTKGTYMWDGSGRFN